MFKKSLEDHKANKSKRVRVESPVSNVAIHSVASQDNVNPSETTTTPLIFSATSSSNIPTSSQPVKKQEAKAFLKLVAEREQDQAGCNLRI